jgi:predicted aldo/keto reductase-like oxidoreductase
MLRRRFGRTEIAMPVLTAGGMRFMHGWEDRALSAIPRENQANVEATLERALELGINHVETARAYGSSERQLGAALAKVPRDSVILQTKVTPQENPEQFRVDFLDSLSRLRVTSVELLSLHGVNDRKTLEWCLRPGGCFEVAQRLREQGLCRFIGFSTHAPLDVILDGIRYGEARTGAGFDYVNLHWYFIFQRNWPAILEARQRDMGVFIISPNDKGGRLYEPPPQLVELCKPLHPMVFNDLFCLMHPEVHTLSIGAARPSDYAEHVEAVALVERARELVPPIVERLRAAMSSAIGHADPEAYSAGLPPWQDTPGKLNLEVMLWLRNLALGWGLGDYAKKRFNLMGSADHWFPGARPSASKFDEAALARAVAGSPHSANIPSLVRESLALLLGEATQRESRSAS